MSLPEHLRRDPGKFLDAEVANLHVASNLDLIETTLKRKINWQASLVVIFSSMLFHCSRYYRADKTAQERCHPGLATGLSHLSFEEGGLNHVVLLLVLHPASTTSRSQPTLR
jgi:hypothetical protein